MDEEDRPEDLITIVGRGEEGVDETGEEASYGDDKAQGLPEVPQDQGRGARITAQAEKQKKKQSERD
jgi:hypothetical protein